ncbi:hypothetical protein B0T16DRAFT_416638 [Cercophora newfieldiana]|uniref:Uncharacterized protein n=1 Tax=Cercophora newfieldiana TaxID=92897 RepID=A0AA39Y294_9PEZI|nr:hypothetical protein B0T16DRAFT_416638 [Cercophora newfieldiana]
MDKFRSGYIVDKFGVTVGLTEENTAGMKFYGLLPHPTVKGDFQGARACVSVDGAPCVEGTALLDTGLSVSFLSMPKGTVMKRGEDDHLLDGSVVSIRFGEPDATAVATEKFTVGRPVMPDVNPDNVTAVIRDPTFVNTGRKVYREWVTAFDGVVGRYGFRAA